MIRIVDTDRDFAELEREWRRLEAETRSSVFSCFDFIHCSWECLRKPAHRLLLLVSETGGNIDTIAPFFVCRDSYRGFPYGRIGFIAAWAGDRPGILTTLPEEEAWRRILDFLEEEVKGWDAIDLVEQPKEACGGNGRGLQAHGSCYWEETPGGVGYYISMKGSWESYLRRIDPKVKSNLNNRMNRLSRRPEGYTVDCFSRPDEMGGALARYIAVEKSGWKGESGVGLARDERHTAFYERLLVRLAEKGIAYVYILRSGRDDLSAAIRFHHQGRLYERHIAYSPAFSEYSPGIILKTWVIRNWFGAGCDECDMLLVIAPWIKKGKACNPGEQAKADWATDTRETVSLRGYRYRSRLLPWILAKKAKRSMSGLLRRGALLALAAVAFAGSPAGAATIYADPGIAADCAGSYDPAARSCGGGDAVAFRTLAGAADAARPGDTVLLREGIFREPLAPPRSGEPGMPVSFKGYPGEAATLSTSEAPAIRVSGRSHLVIEGLVVTESQGWARVDGSHDIAVRSNRFSRATARGTTGGLKLVRSTRVFIVDNAFDEGNDSLVLQESDRNVVRGNTFTTARHSLLSIRCGSFNVIRGNRFHNVRQKAVEIYDCEGTSDAPVRLDATKRNLIEGNAFAFTRGSDRNHRYNGIQLGGQDGIFRKNVFHDNEGGALNFQVYEDESLYSYGNRVFNNTFYNNRCYAVSAQSGAGRGRYSGNVVKNNLLYKNTSCGGRNVQTSIGNGDAVKLERNAVLTEPPPFVDEGGRDLRLAEGSPMIDAGDFATRAVGAGSGRVLPVEDAGYFYDGFGIPGEAGDEIRLEGESSTARIVRIDYAERTLSVDRPIAWVSGQGVHLQYSGRSPDIGAFER